MLGDVVPDVARPELVARRRQVALDVARGEPPQPVQQPRHDEQPGKGEVPFARAGEIVMAGHRRPAREGAVLDVALMVGPIAEQPGRRNRHRPDAQEAPVGGAADLQPRRIVVRAEPAPVQPRMRVEDHQPAHQHDRQRQRVEPVPDSRGEPVAVDKVAAGGRGGTGVAHLRRRGGGLGGSAEQSGRRSWASVLQARTCTVPSGPT